MNRKLRAGRHGLRLALVTTAVLGIAAGVAYATIPGPAGVINGCYRTSLDDQRGQLRVVEDPASCRSSETAIQWNQQGPKGDTGEQGIPGIQGDVGAMGPEGPKGDKGDKGDTGAAGANGANGASGATGEKGEKGDPGTNGTNGADGANGVNGTNGVDGTPGTSVASAAEPPGANCTSGGSKFTSATGTTYACNGSAGVLTSTVIRRDTNFGAVSAGGDGRAGGVVIATCPVGSVLTGGAARAISDVAIKEQYPVDGHSYAADFFGTNAFAVARGTVIAICLELE